MWIRILTIMKLLPCLRSRKWVGYNPGQAVHLFSSWTPQPSVEPGTKASGGDCNDIFLTLSFCRTFNFHSVPLSLRHVLTLSHIFHWIISHLFHIAAHFSLVVLQHLCRQLLIIGVFQWKIPNFTLNDGTLIGHSVQQDLLQGHLGGFLVMRYSKI